MPERVDGNDQPAVLFFCNRNLYVDEATAIAKAGSNAGSWRPIFVDAALRARPAPTVEAKRPRQSTVSHWTTRPRPAIVDAFANVAAALRSRHEIEGLLGRTGASAIVVFDDRIIRPEFAAIRAARRYGVPVVMAPYAVSTSEADLFLRSGSSPHAAPPRRCGVLGRLAAARYPRQVHTGTLFYPAAVTLALGTARMLPPEPWQPGRNGADFVCTLDAAQREALIGMGSAEHNVIAAGQASTDVLALDASERKALRARLFEQYGLEADRKLILCAVPQHAEHGMTTWDTHHEATRALFSTLAASGGSVLLALHPKSDRAFYEPLAQEFHLAISNDRLVHCLAAADLFVATFSSTVRWTIGLGIPTIVIDDLASGYRLFRELSGVSVVSDYASLGAVLTSATNADTLSKMKRAAGFGAHLIGPIDGRASERIARTIDAALQCQARLRPIGTGSPRQGYAT